MPHLGLYGKYFSRYSITVKVRPTQTAIDHLTRRVPTAAPSDTVDQLRRRLRLEADHFETINYIYVLDVDQKLVGVVSIKKIFSAELDAHLSRLMDREIVASRPNADQEKIIKLALRHNIKAIPVTDKDQTFLGVVPSDQILQILREEIKEKEFKMVGIDPRHGDSVLTLSVLASFKHRISWVVVGLLGGMLMAGFIDNFTHVLSENIVLAAFIPLVVYIGGAVGAQTEALVIRDLAAKDNLNLQSYGIRHLGVASLMAITCGVLSGGIVWMLYFSTLLSTAVGFAIAAAIIMATLIGVAIPYLLSKLKQDPADGSGPIGTVLIDITSVVVYFSVVTWLY